MVSLVCYLLNISSPAAAGLEKRQPRCPQPPADKKPLGIILPIIFYKEAMKAVPINVTSPGPSGCVPTKAQKDNLDCAGGAVPSERAAELQDSSTTANPNPNPHKGYTSLAKTGVKP